MQLLDFLLVFYEFSILGWLYMSSSVQIQAEKRQRRQEMGGWKLEETIMHFSNGWKPQILILFAWLL